MRDLFDDFLEELRRREAAARGEDPDAGGPRRTKSVGPDPGDDDGDRGDRGGDDGPPPPREPSPPRRRADPQGSSGGGGFRGLGWIVLGIVLLVVVSLLSFGLDLWTDALWYRSVGFDSVFWTRLGAQVGLFAVAGLATLLILLGNLALEIGRAHV